VQQPLEVAQYFQTTFAIRTTVLAIAQVFSLGAPIASDDKLDATQGSSQIDRRLGAERRTFDAVVFTNAEYEVGLRIKLLG
jgi:hypothetical protein